MAKFFQTDFPRFEYKDTSKFCPHILLYILPSGHETHLIPIKARGLVLWGEVMIKSTKIGQKFHLIGYNF